MNGKESFSWPFLHLEERVLLKWLEIEGVLGPDNSSSTQDLEISNGEMLLYEASGAILFFTLSTKHKLKEEKE